MACMDISVLHTNKKMDDIPMQEQKGEPDSKKRKAPPKDIREVSPTRLMGYVKKDDIMALIGNRMWFDLEDDDADVEWNLRLAFVLGEHSK